MARKNLKMLKKLCEKFKKVRNNFFFFVVLLGTYCFSYYV